MQSLPLRFSLSLTPSIPTSSESTDDKDLQLSAMGSYGYPPWYDDVTLNDMSIDFHRLACGCLGDDRIDPRLDCSGHGKPKPWKCSHEDDSDTIVVDIDRYCDSCEEELMRWACGCPNRGSGLYGHGEGLRIVLNCPDHGYYKPWGCGHTDDPGRFNVRNSKGCRMCHGRRIYQRMKEKYKEHHDLYEAALKKVERYDNILRTKPSGEDLKYFTRQRQDWRDKRHNHYNLYKQARSDARVKFERVHDVWNEEEWKRDYEKFRPIMLLLLRI